MHAIIMRSMKYWLSYLVSIILFSVLFTLLLWIFSPSKDKTTSVTSPLPEFLSIDKNKQVTLLDFWAPIVEAMSGGEENALNPTAKAALVYDISSNKTIFEKNAKEKLPMASLTKIMTAIVVLENKKPDDRYRVRDEYLVGEDTMGLKAGQVLTLEELLYGLLLNSGNDASEVIAGNYEPSSRSLPAGRQAFIQAMNNKARALGLTDTQFSNPSGLQGDGVQHTTAYDLLVITRYAIDTFPEFTKYTSTFDITLPATDTHPEFYLQNETNLISTYPGVKGIKTGYTPEAGLCLVTYLDYEGHKIIGILLNSENRRQEMKDLLDYSLKSLGTEPPKHD